jgi:mannose-1-phosphate guanylyltransferase
VSIERETFPALVDDGSLFAVQADDYWIDAGTPETYLEAQLDLIAGRRPERPLAVARDAQVAGDASVRDSVLMRGASLAAGAVVESSVVLPGARIGERATVRGSIVGPRASVGAGARVERMSVLGDGVEVEANASHAGQRLPDEAT